MKWKYRIVLAGRSEYIVAEGRGKAIEAYCNLHGVSREWMAKHATIINCGRAD